MSMDGLKEVVHVTCTVKCILFNFIYLLFNIFLEIFQNVEHMNEMSQDLPLSCRHERDIQRKKKMKEKTHLHFGEIFMFYM